MTLAGILCVRNGTELDYCWKEAAMSLLGVCDELVLCDSDSTDDTRNLMDDWAARNPKITLCNFPWTDPERTNRWWPDFLNYARQHAKSEAVFFLDADEVLHEHSYAEVRERINRSEAFFVHRHNFWRDSRSLIPEGVCCGTKVLRGGPKNFWYPSDYPDPDGRDNEILARAVQSNVQIMHYGFLRKREAFFKKARTVQKIWVGSYDPRLEAAEKFDGPWATMPGVTGWEDKLQAFTGTHPEIAKYWLRERGYEC
jgi:glycosyltransferase involved in cell wall biosynthesis